MPIKLGTTNLKLPFSEVYLGEILKYKVDGTYTDTVFTSSIAPTSWTNVSNVEATATNTYGNWRAYATDSYDSFRAVSRAFDNNNNTMWQPKNTPIIYNQCVLELPFNTLINPTSIKVKYSYLGNSEYPGYLEGYNPSSGEWEILVTIASSTSSRTDNFTVDTNKFYSKFRINTITTKTNFNPSVYELQITNGTVRVLGGA